MHHFNSSAARALVLPPDAAPSVRVVLDAVVRAHRPLLVQVARDHLGPRGQDAEDIVEDVCLAVLEGTVPLSPAPAVALLDLMTAVAHAATRRRRRDRSG